MAHQDCDFRARLIAGIGRYELTGSHGERLVVAANAVLTPAELPVDCCEDFRARALRLFGPDAAKHRQQAAEAAARGEDPPWEELAYDGSTPIGDPRNTMRHGGF